MCAFPYILESPSSDKTLQLLHTEFSYTVYEENLIFFLSAKHTPYIPSADCSERYSDNFGKFSRRLHSHRPCAALDHYQLPAHRKLIQWLPGPSPSLPAAWDSPAVTGPGSKKVRTCSSLFS